MHMVLAADVIREPEVQQLLQLLDQREQVRHSPWKVLHASKSLPQGKQISRFLDFPNPATESSVVLCTSSNTPSPLLPLVRGHLPGERWFV